MLVELANKGNPKNGPFFSVLNMHEQHFLSSRQLKCWPNCERHYTLDVGHESITWGFPTIGWSASQSGNGWTSVCRSLSVQQKVSRQLLDIQRERPKREMLSKRTQHIFRSLTWLGISYYAWLHGDWAIDSEHRRPTYLIVNGLRDSKSTEPGKVWSPQDEMGLRGTGEAVYSYWRDHIF